MDPKRINVFHFIDSILCRPRNNPIQTFDKYIDIESWLRMQWSGLFRELLKQRSSQTQLSSLATQVQELSEVNRTLRRYLEEVVSKVAPHNEASSLIKSEDARLAEAQVVREFEKNDFVRFLNRGDEIPIEVIQKALIQADTSDDFISAVTAHKKENSQLVQRLRFLQGSATALADLNDARRIVGRPKFAHPTTSFSETDLITKKSGTQRKPDRKNTTKKDTE